MSAWISLGLLSILGFLNGFNTALVPGCHRSDYHLVSDTTCMRISPEGEWYAVRRECEDSGGELLDGGYDPQLLPLAGKIMQRSNDSWFWVNAQPVHVEEGNAWMFDDGTPMNFANFDSDYPKHDYVGNNYIVMDGTGVWYDRGSKVDKCQVLCQQLDEDDDLTAMYEIGTDGDDGMTYWLSAFEVWATQAEKSCSSRGGQLARITDYNKQEAILNMYEIEDVELDGRYCIAGNFVTAVDFPKSGYYWLESKKRMPASGSYIYGSGVSLSLRNHQTIVNWGRHASIGVKPGICVADSIKVKQTIKTTPLPKRTTPAQTTERSTTRQPSTTPKPVTTPSPPSPQNTSLHPGGETQLMVTAKYLLSLNCTDAMVEPQPALTQSVANYKYKDLILVCDCFDQRAAVEISCKQRMLTIRWPTNRFYKQSDSSALSRDKFIFTKRAEFMHLVHGPQMFALNILKNMPPVVFPEKQLNGLYLAFDSQTSSNNGSYY